MCRARNHEPAAGAELRCRAHRCRRGARSGAQPHHQPGYLVWAQDEGEKARVYRYGAGFAAPEPLLGDLIGSPADIGPFSATKDLVFASRFCGGCQADLVEIDVNARRVTAPTVDGPWAGKLLGMLKFSAGFVVRTSSTEVLGLQGTTRSRLFETSRQLAGAASGEPSYAVTVNAPEGSSPHNVELVTPTMLDSIGDASSVRRRAPVLLDVASHRLVLDGSDLFVATTPLFGCGPQLAWIAKLPRLLQ